MLLLLLGTVSNMGAEGSYQCGHEECVVVGAPQVFVRAECTVEPALSSLASQMKSLRLKEATWLAQGPRLVRAEQGWASSPVLF